MSQESQKKQAAFAAIEYIQDDTIVGVGTGSTVNYFIEALTVIKGRIKAAVASSKATEKLLKSHNIPVYDLNAVTEVDVYIDGADQINNYLQCIKGGGGALTGEKIIASVAKQFICIADNNKLVKMLGAGFPLAVEVIPMARSCVARKLVAMGGDPVYREGFISDYGNVILDVHNLEIMEPIKWEQELNHIPGVVCHGLFAERHADILLLGTDDGVKVVK